MDEANPPVFYLLTAEGFDTAHHHEIHVCGVSKTHGFCHCIIDTFKPMFFVPRYTPHSLTALAYQRKQLPLHALDSTLVDCVYFNTQQSLLQSRKSIHQAHFSTYESDIATVERYLMERFIKAGFTVSGSHKIVQGISTYVNPTLRGCDVEPSIRILSLDIETNGYTSEIYSIGFSGIAQKVFIRTQTPDDSDICCCADEKEMLSKALHFIHTHDPDIIIGWNIINFDLPILQRRCKEFNIEFQLHRISLPNATQSTQTTQRHFLLNGRIIIDVPILLRMQQSGFEDLSLNTVANNVLKKSKSIELTGRDKVDHINSLFINDPLSLAKYNLLDTQLTEQILHQTRCLSNIIERQKLCGQRLDTPKGSIANFDYLYLPLLHRKNYIGLDKPAYNSLHTQLGGGYVMNSLPGIHRNVLLFDFRSLYPSIIMTFFIDPLASAQKQKPLIHTPSGHTFSRDFAILPGIISDLMKARQQAKDTNNHSLSYAIKIIMNSFYGVLGSTGCRFFSKDLAEAITQTGQYILKNTIEFIEKAFSFPVIYGDTDSLFVHINDTSSIDIKAISSKITAEVNAWLSLHLAEHFGVESKLHLQFEQHFTHFFMPTIRGCIEGSKKRYCGTVEINGQLKLVFKGLESVRSDWTALAKRFQSTLYEKIFLKQPIDSFILETVSRLKSGKLDDELIYSKQLRKPISEYTAHLPPHVKAALLMKRPGRRIKYYMTVAGPEPTENRSSPLDYEHYIQTQLKPIADSILLWIHKDFDSIITGQQNLFDL